MLEHLFIIGDDHGCVMYMDDMTCIAYTPPTYHGCVMYMDSRALIRVVYYHQGAGDTGLWGWRGMQGIQGDAGDATESRWSRQKR